ncbi:helix-turn-helix transcriptional regulator [Photobacterium damselae subsp. damselae]|uniref:helix-turn-helix domain-containing protein n=1 Tax=Photobacterium damselae TaxID=38293 RepID=UPI00311AC5AF
MTYTNKADVRNNDKDDPFQKNGKGSINERIRGLINGRTTRQVAKDWGIPLSTLSTYLSKDTMPSVDRAFKIAQSEGVTIEWLLNGGDLTNGITDSHRQTKTLTNEPAQEEPNDDISTAERICTILGKERAGTLLEALIEHGVSGVMFSERTRKTAMIIDTLPDDAAKEIFELAAEAQYCSLVGLPFKPTRKDPSVYKKASNQN